ncbi:MAG TPA: hypothetical protein VJ279_11870 [Hanamia sp.]|jgi:hypothetical protein|nr:hypothetical protein [Hanamia sp.]
MKNKALTFSEYMMHKNGKTVFQESDWVLHDTSRVSTLDVGQVYARASRDKTANKTRIAFCVGECVYQLLELKETDLIAIYYHNKNPYNVMLRKSTIGKGFRFSKASHAHTHNLSVLWRGNAPLKTDNVTSPVNFDIHENKTLTVDLSIFSINS